MKEQYSEEAVRAVQGALELALEAIRIAKHLDYEVETLGDAKNVMAAQGYPIMAQVVDFFTSDEGDCTGTGILGDVLSGRLSNSPKEMPF